MFYYTLLQGQHKMLLPPSILSLQKPYGEVRLRESDWPKVS